MSLWSAVDILSRSALLAGSMATEKDGGGNAIGSYRIGASLSHSVAFVDVAVSFGMAQMSPAPTASVISCSLPRRKKIWPTRSVSPFVASYTCEL